jgi:hypothetical protein
MYVCHALLQHAERPPSVFYPGKYAEAATERLLEYAYVQSIQEFSCAGFGRGLAHRRPLVQSLSAQDGKRSEEGPPILAHQRSRSSGNIPALTGEVARSIVPERAVQPTSRKLAIHLQTIPLNGNQRAFGIFYEFSTMEIPRSNGFSITTGISTLSCQVNGMNLDYSGPPKSVEAAR